MRCGAATPQQGHKFGDLFAWLPVAQYVGSPAAGLAQWNFSVGPPVNESLSLIARGDTPVTLYITTASAFLPGANATSGTIVYNFLEFTPVADPFPASTFDVPSACMQPPARCAAGIVQNMTIYLAHPPYSISQYNFSNQVGP